MASEAWKEVKETKQEVNVWKPSSVGEELIGEYYGVDTVEGRYGPYQRHVFKSDGELWGVAGAMLDRKLANAHVRMDQTVKLVYAGTQQLEGDKTQKLFRVYVK